ncbi:MAG: UbiD family decarboxylase [Dehalococcoidia bacterium]|nr:UbiD family decarboxylase [Dehalococcoidia bacterium]
MAVPRDVRSLITLLEKKGDLVRVQTEVDPLNFELSALVRHEEDGHNRAILFEKVKGYRIPVIANLFGSIGRVACGLGIEPTAEEVERYRRDPHGSLGGFGGSSLDAYTLSDEDRARTLLVKEKIFGAEEEAGKGRYPVKMVNTAPCKEVVITRDIDLPGTLPVPWLCELDGGPFITPAVLVQKDPDTGLLNAGIHRHQVGGEKYGKKRMGALLSEHSDGFRIQQKYEAMGKPCEIALCIAPEPVIEIAASYFSPGLRVSPPYSEFNSAGAMLGEPLELVRCATVDLAVPINTEIVIEGFIPPNERIYEGPMAEYPDFYSRQGPLTFVEVTAITHRRDPIFHTCLSGGSREHLVLGALSCIGGERVTLVNVQKLFPTVRDVGIVGGSRRGDLVVSFRKRFEGEDKLLLYHLMATTTNRYVTIVDEDIEPHDTEQVEWARATRAGASPDDFHIFPSTRTFNLDPEQDKDVLATRVGILATMPFGQKYVRTGPPSGVLERTRSLYEKEVLKKD